MKRLSYRMIDGSGSSRRYPAGLRLRCSGRQSDLNKLWRWRSSFYIILNCLFHHLFIVHLFLTFVSSVGAVEDAVRDERLADASRTAARAFEFPWLTICNQIENLCINFSQFYTFLDKNFGYFLFTQKSKNKWRMRSLIGGRLCEAQQNEKLSICSCRLPNRSLPLDLTERKNKIKITK